MADISVSFEEYAKLKLSANRAEAAEARAAQLVEDHEKDARNFQERIDDLAESNREQDETITVLSAEVQTAWKYIEEIRTALGAYPEHDALSAARRCAAMLRDVTQECDAFAAENDAIHRAVNAMCGTADVSTIEAVRIVVDERDAQQQRADILDHACQNALAERDELKVAFDNLRDERDEALVKLEQCENELRGMS
jgi:hypothetical protein